MKNQLIKFKGYMLDPVREDYSAMIDAPITSLDALTETFAVRKVRITMDDGIVLNLIRDGDAINGIRVDTYA